MSDALAKLAAEFCAFIDAPVPSLTADADGVFAFHATVRGVRVAVSHDPIDFPGHAMVHVVFGQLPAHRELAVLRDLMATNFELRLPQAPAFSLNPHTGDVVLRYSHAFTHASADDLWTGLQALLDTALLWRSDPAADERDGGFSTAPPCASLEIFGMA